MEHLMEEYGGMILAVLAGIFLVGFAMAMVQQDGMVTSFVLENCLRAV